MQATKGNDEKLFKAAAEIKKNFQPGEIAQLIRLIAATPTTGEMSSEQFERLIQDLEAKNNRRGFSEKSIEAARLVLVMGASISEAAADTALTRQSVNQLMQRIRRRMESLPEGWKQVTEWFPADVAKQIEDIAELLKTSNATDNQLDAQTFTISLSRA